MRQKNHAFLIEIVNEFQSRGCPVKLLMLGNGPIRTAIEDRVRSAGLANEAIFAGVRADVPRVMLGAMDVFVFPSHYEGLGLVLLERRRPDCPAWSPTEFRRRPESRNRCFIPCLSRTAAEWADVILGLPSVEVNRDRTIGAARQEGF